MTIQPASTAQPSPLDAFASFSAFLDRYAALAALCGKKIRRERPEEARRLFDALTQAKQETIINRIAIEVSLLEEALAAQRPLSDSPYLLWRYFTRHRAVPCADLFSHIRDTDVVEIYGLDQVHVFQNFAFFDFISLTLERIYCQAWWELSQREPRHAQAIYEAAVSLITGQVQSTIEPPVPFHLVEEVDAEIGFKFELRLKCLSPVMTEGKLSHIVAVSECRFP